MKDMKFNDILNIAYTDSGRIYLGDDDKILRAKVIATHAGRLTGNGKIYLPSKMSKSAKRWISPYPKPVLSAHNEVADPIGRVRSARFIKTYPDKIDASIANSVYNIKRINPDSIDVINKIENRLFDPNFAGFGYMSLELDITDRDAIEKILDGRYLSLSVGMASNAMYCSVCGNDMRSSDCEHYLGQIVDGRMVFGITDELYPLEVSYVNIPADELAMTEDVSLVTKDGQGQTDYTVFSEYVQDADITILGNKKTVVTVDKNINNNNRGGNTMKLTMKSLLKSTEDNYAVLKKYLPENVQPLTEDQLKELGNDVFLGSNRTFPVVDMAHVEAIEKMLEDVNDSVAKKEFIDIFVDAKKELKAKEDAQALKDKILSADSIKELDNDELKLANDLLQDELKERGIADSEDSDDVDEVKVALKVVKDHNAQLKQMLNITRDSVKDLITELTDAYAHMIVDLKKISGETIEDEDSYLKTLKTRTMQSLKDLYQDLRDSLKASGKKVDGEEDPTIHNDTTVDKDTKQKIIDQYNFLLKNVGVEVAKDYLDMKIKSGEFDPEEK